MNRRSRFTSRRSYTLGFGRPAVIVVVAGSIALGGCAGSTPNGAGPQEAGTAGATTTRQHRDPQHQHGTSMRTMMPPAHQAHHGGEVATVDHVVDGDTIDVKLHGQTRSVRIIGIDTPEEYKPGVPVECGARDAAAHMQALLSPRDTVRLAADPTQSRTDRYDRLLRYVIHAGTDIGLSQVRNGWAEVYIFEGVTFQRARGYQRAAAKAKAARDGVYEECGGDFHSAQHGSSGTDASSGSSSHHHSSSSSGGSGSSDCDPNYKGACLKPDSPDYDCAGGEGNGPDYTGPVQVVGDDHYDLDADGDGYACESG